MRKTLVFLLIFKVMCVFTFDVSAEKFLILNATSGLGESIVNKLKSENHSLVLTARDISK
jgi:hypothetical protein